MPSEREFSGETLIAVWVFTPEWLSLHANLYFIIMLSIRLVLKANQPETVTFLNKNSISVALKIL